jgi:hypothetical protein
VAGVERLEGERAVGARRRAVDYCHVNSSHGTKIYFFTFLIDSLSLERTVAGAAGGGQCCDERCERGY